MLRFRTIMVMVLVLMGYGEWLAAQVLRTPPVHAPAPYPTMYNVKAYGAVGDGVTNDDAAITAAYTAAKVTGGTLFFPAGRYLIDSITLDHALEVTWLGEGMYASVIVGNSATTLFPPPGSGGPLNPTFMHLGFDGANVATNGILNSTGTIGRVTIWGCRFTRFTGMAFYNFSSPILVAYNIIEATSNTAIFLDGPIYYGDILYNRIRYTKNGIIGNTGAGASTSDSVISGLNIVGNFIDLGFYTLIHRETDDGGDVTYTATKVIDSDANFSGFTANDFIRVMPTKESGTAVIGWTEVSDGSATFIATGVIPGDIIRSGGKFAIVAAVESETILHVEEWLSETDRTIVASPPNGTYTVYGVILGKYQSHTATEITVDRWYTLLGATVTPTNGTRYELLPIQPNYPIHCETGCNNNKFYNNTILRGYSDQISVFGTENDVSHNLIKRGQDMGITIHGAYNKVIGNTLVFAGVGGVSTVTMTQSIIGFNTILNTTWTVEAFPFIGGIILDGSRNTVVGNQVSVTATMPQADYGIVVAGLADNNTLNSNATNGHGVAGIRLDDTGGAPTNTRVLLHTSSNETEYSIAAGAKIAPISTGEVLTHLPTTQVIAAGNTITADACGGTKRISSASAVTTDTTNTITAPAAANAGCRMSVCNMNASDAITLDKNANILLTGGANVALGAGCCVDVISTGAAGVWRQLTAQLCGS